MLVDTHCHIHEAVYPLDIADVLERAQVAGVGKMICVGTNEQSSLGAIDAASSYDCLFAAVGVHPHDTSSGWSAIAELARKKPVAIGEIGLDYFYTHSPREVQIEALQSQIETALAYDLPIIFHVREAFDDFWPIFDNFHGIRGVLHSFTDTQINLEEGLKRGLFVGVNGISTFTKNTAQQRMFASVPLERLLLETDAPYLTPSPLRGTINEPAFIKNIAEFVATSHRVSFAQIADHSSTNAHDLFGLQTNT